MQPTTRNSANDRSDYEISPLDVIASLVDNKWLIAGFVCAFAIMGASYAFLAAPVYRVSSVLQVEPRRSSVPDFSPVTQTPTEKFSTLTEVHLMTSAAVIGDAVNNLRLHIQVEPRTFPLLGGVIARRYAERNPGELNQPIFGLRQFAWGGESMEVGRLELPERLLEKRLTLVAGEAGSYVLHGPDGEVLAEGRVGEVATKGAVQIAVESLQANPGARFTLVRERPLTTVLRYQRLLEAKELSEESGIVSLSLASARPEQARLAVDEISRLYLQRNRERAALEATASLEFLQGQIPALRERLEASENALNHYQAQEKSVDITMEIQATLNQIVALDTQISELTLQQADLARRFTEEHPTYQTIVSQIASLTNKQQRLAERIETLPETQQELVRLTREVKVNNELYLLMMNRAQELDVTRKGAVGNARLVDAALYDASRPVRPVKAVTLLIAVGLGFLVAVAFIALRRLLHPAIENPMAIEQLGVPVFANVPLSKLTRADAPLAAKRTDEPAVEALRSLRTTLHFAMLKAGSNRLMITGPTPFVGKSFVAANLAAVVAQAGQKVLLIDADMRKGHLHEMFEINAEEGLADVLAGRAALESALRQTSVEGLSFLSRGNLGPNPSELLMRPAFSDLLNAVSERFDLVIIDTPPLLAVTDAVIVGHSAGASLLVARFGLTASREITQCVERMQQSGLELRGAVFNAVEKRASTSYGYSKAYNAYSYRIEGA